MRLIDADRLTRPEMLRMCYHLPNGDTAMPIGDIEHAPTVDAALVKHGRWDDSFDGITPYCSICHMTHKCFKRTPNYCPNCGAKMDLEEQGAKEEN